MPGVKTAISLKKPLFQQVEVLARRMKVPRSRLFAMALEDFLRRYETKEMIRRLNESYREAPSSEERAFHRKTTRLFWRTVQDPW